MEGGKKITVDKGFSVVFSFIEALCPLYTKGLEDISKLTVFFKTWKHVFCAVFKIGKFLTTVQKVA